MLQFRFSGRPAVRLSARDALDYWVAQCGYTGRVQVIPRRGVREWALGLLLYRQDGRCRASGTPDEMDLCIGPFATLAAPRDVRRRLDALSCLARDASL